MYISQGDNVWMNANELFFLRYVPGTGPFDLHASWYVQDAARAVFAFHPQVLPVLPC